MFSKYVVVITCVEELVRYGLADERVAALVAVGSWYLVGSRAAGVADEFSDWDTIVLSPTDANDLPVEITDEVFGISRPRLSGPPTLAMHVSWRRAQGVDVQVCGPSACRRRMDDDLPAWAFELGHAVPLHESNDAGNRYRAEVAATFDRACPALAAAAYAAFRQSRNEAVATLPRLAETDQAMVAAACVRHAARFWLLATGAPHPADKWLLAALRRTDAGAVPAMAAAVDLRLDPAARFDALWHLWEAVDQHALTHRIAAEQLTGSPFIPDQACPAPTNTDPDRRHG